MSAMTSAQILAAIAASPALQTLATARNDAAIAAQLSVGRTATGSVPVPTFAAWCASTGLRAVIEDASNNAASPLRSASLAIKDLLAWQSGALDLSSDPVGTGNLAMLQAWVTAGAITQAQHDALIALASQPDPVTVDQVSRALNGN